eukprot:31494-Pyramimonas_sp.AAC.1
MGQARCARGHRADSAKNIQLQRVAAGKLPPASCPRLNKRDSDQNRAPPTHQRQKAVGGKAEGHATNAHTKTRAQRLSKGCWGQESKSQAAATSGDP